MDKNIIIYTNPKGLEFSYQDLEDAEGLINHGIIMCLINKIRDQADEAKEALNFITGLHEQLRTKDKTIKEQAEEIKKLKEELFTWEENYIGRGC